MTFEAVFGEAGSFKKILDAIGEVLDDVTLLCKLIFASNQQFLYGAIQIYT